MWNLIVSVPDHCLSAVEIVLSITPQYFVPFIQRRLRGWNYNDLDRECISLIDLTTYCIN